MNAISEARKKLVENIRPRTKEEITEFVRVEELHKKEQELKEEIKRKKEELRLKKEEKLVKFKRGIRRMLNDEEAGIREYEKLIQEARTLATPWSLVHVKDLEIILTEERQHLSRLRAMMG